MQNSRFIEKLQLIQNLISSDEPEEALLYVEELIQEVTSLGDFDSEMDINME